MSQRTTIDGQMYANDGQRKRAGISRMLFCIDLNDERGVNAGSTANEPCLFLKRTCETT